MFTPVSRAGAASHSSHRIVQSSTTAAVAATVGLMLAAFAAPAAAAPITITTATNGGGSNGGADVEIREQNPEDLRQTISPTELATRVTSAQNTAFLLRFDLTGRTVADLQGVADIRLFSRNAGLGGTNAGGIKIYGLNPANSLATTWSETTAHYRDAGDALPISPAGGHPGSQPSSGAVPNAPVAPINVANPPSWNANASDPTRAPGLAYQNPPFSQSAQNTNTTRYNNNLAKKTAYDADLADNGVIDAPAGTYNYETYINQPGYTQQVTNANYPDLVVADLPLNSIGADATGAGGDYTQLGYLNYDAKNPSRAAGTMFSFTTGSENSPVNMGSAVTDANNTALVNFLTNLLNNNYTSATFLIMQKNSIDADTAPVRSDNLIFASKEFDPGTGVGAWAPQLILGPEPGAATALLALAAPMLARARRRRGD